MNVCRDCREALARLMTCLLAKSTGSCILDLLLGSTLLCIIEICTFDLKQANLQICVACWKGSQMESILHALQTARQSDHHVGQEVIVCLCREQS